MKILYAVGNRIGAYFQFERFISSLKNKNIVLKTAAYIKSLGNLACDYTLDCLLNFSNSNSDISRNGNFSYYANEIRRFAPDVIISDLEPFTSLLAIEQNIPLWQASPLLLLWGLPFQTRQKLELNNKTNYNSLFGSYRNKQIYNSIVKNADKRVIISHLMDVSKIEILPEYQFARPDFILLEQNEHANQKYTIHHNINRKMYIKQLSGSSHIISPGYEHITADAIYNGKNYSYERSFQDIETTVLPIINTFFGSGSLTEPVERPTLTLNEQIKFLHELI